MREKKLHMLRHSVESDITKFQNQDLKILPKGYCHYIQRRKLSDALFIREKSQY